MQYFDESVIRDCGDEVTHRFLDLWHEECLSYFKHDIEVGMVDRLENPQLRKMDGIVNAATPHISDENVSLVLWLQDINTHPPEAIVVTHEIGHWILVLRGFKSFLDPNDMFSENAGSLNSLAQHLPLFSLQRSLGHEPQEMIDIDTENDTNFYREFKERNPRRWISDALYIADHLTSCSENYRLKLNNVLRKRMPNVNRLVRNTIQLIERSDLHSPENNEKFCLQLIKELKFENWVEYDQLGPFKKHFGK